MSPSQPPRPSPSEDRAPRSRRFRGSPSTGLLPRGVFALLIGASIAWLAVAVVVGFGVPIPSLPGASASANSGSGVDYLYLTIAFNPQTGSDQYFPANFTVPAHTSVVVTITNYDDGVNLVPTDYSHVLGTVGGTMSVTDPTTGATSTVASVPLSGISHTFTVFPAGGGSNPLINVPIPAAAGGLQPSQVTFTINLGASGSYGWMCMAPCDPGSMGTPGLMAGILEVA